MDITLTASLLKATKMNADNNNIPHKLEKGFQLYYLHVKTHIDNISHNRVQILPSSMVVLVLSLMDITLTVGLLKETKLNGDKSKEEK